jgi:hypothetical protein
VQGRHSARHLAGKPLILRRLPQNRNKTPAEELILPHLGTIKGSGLVYLGDELAGKATYVVSVYSKGPDGSLRDAYGALAAPSNLLLRAFNAADPPVLELETGGTLTFSIINAVSGGGQADIDVSGPVPGFE